MLTDILPVLAAQAPAWMNSLPWIILAALGVPAAVTGLFIRRLEKSLDRREAAREAERQELERRAEEKERQREQMDVVMLQCITAALSVGEATAVAVQRIPDAHCNGDMTRALEYVKEVKQEKRKFFESVGIHALHED